MPKKPIYVTGHRNPDTDSIASAIGYAELKRRLDPGNEYVAVRLGELNPQTRWALARAGAPEPELLEHVMLRAKDVMQTNVPYIAEDDSVREAGLAMARTDYDIVPVVDTDNTLVGVVTVRALARSYIRESREPSTLREATSVEAVVDVLDGKLVLGHDRPLAGRVWVQSMDVSNTPSGISEGDVVVVGNRIDAQRFVIEKGIALMVTSNNVEPTEEVLELARKHGTAVICSPLDTYVSGRMITLAAPCRVLMDTDEAVVMADDLISDISQQIQEGHHGSAVVVDARKRPIGLVIRSDLVSARPRRVLLVDHAERSQSVFGVDEAEIVEILDHHNIGSIVTREPMIAVFDPVGSTATLVVERFRSNGMEPARATATMLLAAVLSDTVILNSPTTTERDHSVVEYLQRVLALDAQEFGRQMFEETTDVSAVSAEDLIRRDAKSYQSGSGHPVVIAQVEVVGTTLLDRKPELLEAMQRERSAQGLQTYALMVTDVLSKATELLVDGDVQGVARAFGVEPNGDALRLPGVMSRKKQVAPKLMAAL